MTSQGLPGINIAKIQIFLMKDNNPQIQSKELVTNSDRLALPIENLIHVIRGQQVMIDSDLAKLYGVETKVLNQAVKRNLSRFPEDFMFQLSKDEFQGLRSQIVTSNEGNRRGGVRYMPYVFTENGVAMLSSVLKSESAIKVNIQIMRAFVAMRNFLMNNVAIFQRMERIELKQLKTDEKVDAIFDKLNSCEEPKQGIFFNGQIFDAYVFIADLIRKAKQRIILFDNYIDDTVLVQLSKRVPGVTVDIYDANISTQLRQDVEAHNAQYPGVTLHRYNKAHDRFLVIDEEVYHIGASLKDLGKKLFGFSKMDVLTGSELLSQL